jgi:hypothetical protein
LDKYNPSIPVKKGNSRKDAPKFLHGFGDTRHMSKKESGISFYLVSSWCLVYREEATRRKTYGEIDKKTSTSKQNEVGQVGVHSRLCKLYYKGSLDYPRYSSMSLNFLEQLSWQLSYISLQKPQIQKEPVVTEVDEKGLLRILHL